ncbi:hypothetical protein DL96DRAFT_1567368 [Flagelloscypha sp. PMI_526]|nr:hypothetical protein DL96DRAFT_1567368 [Flagelloscypha sp. PMI_526]
MLLGLPIPLIYLLIVENNNNRQYNNYQPYKGPQNRPKKGSGRQGQRKGGRGGGRRYNPLNNGHKNQSKQSTSRQHARQMAFQATSYTPSPFLQSTGWDNARVYGVSNTGGYYDNNWIWQNATDSTFWHGIDGDSWRNGPINKTPEGYLVASPPPPVYTNFNNLPLPEEPAESHITLVNPPEPAFHLMSVSDAMDYDSNYSSDSYFDSTGPNTPSDWGKHCEEDCDGSGHWGPCNRPGGTIYDAINWASNICEHCEQPVHWGLCEEEIEKKKKEEAEKQERFEKEKLEEERKRRHEQLLENAREFWEDMAEQTQNGQEFCVNCGNYHHVKLPTSPKPFAPGMEPIPLPTYLPRQPGEPWPNPILCKDGVLDTTFDARRICHELGISETPEVMKHIDEHRWMYLDVGSVKLKLGEEGQPIEVFYKRPNTFQEQKTIDPRIMKKFNNSLKLDDESGNEVDIKSFELIREDELVDSINKSFYNPGNYM